MINFSNTEATLQSTSEAAKPIKDIRPQWKALAAKREITSEDIATLCIYRAVYKEQILEGAKTRLQKSFSPITNPVKLENGAVAYGAMITALNSIKYSHFAEWLDKEELQQLIDAAKETLKAGIE
jgi:hypothetical protein